MSEKTIPSRIILKNGTFSDWLKASNFIPKLGEVVFTRDDNNNFKSFTVGNNSGPVAMCTQYALVPMPSATNEGYFLTVKNSQPEWVAIPSAEEGEF